MADMEVDKVTDIEVNMVADMEMDMVANIDIDIAIVRDESLSWGLVNWAQTFSTRSLLG